MEGDGFDPLSGPTQSRRICLPGYISRVVSFYDLVDIVIQKEVDVNLCNHFDRLTVK